MQASVEETSGLGRKLRIEVPASEVDGAIKQRMQNLKGQVRINGFRPGKVPMSVLEQRFGESVREEVTGELMQKSVGEAIQENELRPVRIDNVDTDKDAENLVFTAEFDVFPTIELKGLEGIKVEKTVAEITSDDMDKAVENLLRSRADFEDVDRAAADGDRVITDFVGKIDGEAFDGGAAEDASVDLGSGGFLPDFEKGLAGVKAGDEKVFEVNFPAEYGAEKLAGKTAEFTANVKSVQGATLPELDDAFAEQMGFTDGVAALREAMEKNLKDQAEKKFAQETRDQVMEGLYEANKGFALPETLVEAELEGAKQRAEQSGEEAPGDADARADAEKRVSLGLLVAEVSRAREITVDEQRVNQRLFEVIGNNPQAYEMFQAYREDENVMQSLQTSILEEQVVESLMGTASVTETSKPYTEIMGG